MRAKNKLILFLDIGLTVCTLHTGWSKRDITKLSINPLIRIKL